jgi:hypothetical protein
MATVQMVKAEDLESGDLIDLSEVVDEGDLIHGAMDMGLAKVDGEPEDVDRWHVKIYTDQGEVIVTRDTEFPYGGVSE